jgi:hypothetical protein
MVLIYNSSMSLLVLLGSLALVTLATGWILRK